MLRRPKCVVGRAAVAHLVQRLHRIRRVLHQRLLEQLVFLLIHKVRNVCILRWRWLVVVIISYFSNSVSLIRHLVCQIWPRWNVLVSASRVRSMIITIFIDDKWDILEIGHWIYFILWVVAFSVWATDHLSVWHQSRVVDEYRLRRLALLIFSGRQLMYKWSVGVELRILDGTTSWLALVALYQIILYLCPCWFNIGINYHLPQVLSLLSLHSGRCNRCKLLIWIGIGSGRHANGEIRLYYDVVLEIINARIHLISQMIGWLLAHEIWYDTITLLDQLSVMVCLLLQLQLLNMGLDWCAVKLLLLMLCHRMLLL